MTKIQAGWGDVKEAPQLFFLLALVLGAAGVLLFKIYGAPAFLVILWPVVVLGSYSALVWVPGFKLRPDQTGDNVYYLGFLFTLVSLAFTLYKFNVATGVEQVVQNFGVAISSTIAGVAGRVLLNQMRTDPFDTERATRLALVDASKQLREELDSSTLEFNAFRRQSQQAIGDAMREMRDIATQQLQNTSGALETTIKETTTRIEAVIVGWSDQARAFNDQSAALVKAMTDLSGKLEAVRAPSSIIEEKIEPAGAAISAFTAATYAAATGLAQAIKQLEASAQQAEVLANASAVALEATKAQSVMLTKSSELLDRIQVDHTEIRRGGEDFQAGVNGTVGKLTDALGTFLVRLDQGLAAAQHRAEQVNSEDLAKVLDSLSGLTVKVEQLAQPPGEPVEVSGSGGSPTTTVAMADGFTAEGSGDFGFRA